MCTNTNPFLLDRWGAVQDHCLPGAWGLGQGFPSGEWSEGGEQSRQLVPVYCTQGLSAGVPLSLVPSQSREWAESLHQALTQDLPSETL